MAPTPIEPTVKIQGLAGLQEQAPHSKIAAAALESINAARGGVADEDGFTLSFDLSFSLFSDEGRVDEQAADRAE